MDIVTLQGRISVQKLIVGWHLLNPTTCKGIWNWSMANYARFQPFMTGLMLHLLLTTLSKMMLNKPSNQYKQMTARYPPSTRLSSWRPKRKSYLLSKSILWLMMSTTLSNVIIAKKVSKANRSSLYILEYILERVSHTYFNSFIVLNLKNTVTF